MTVLRRSSCHSLNRSYFPSLLLPCLCFLMSFVSEEEKHVLFFRPCPPQVLQTRRASAPEGEGRRCQLFLFSKNSSCKGFAWEAMLYGRQESRTNPVRPKTLLWWKLNFSKSSFHGVALLGQTCTCTSLHVTRMPGLSARAYLSRQRVYGWMRTDSIRRSSTGTCVHSHVCRCGSNMHV